MNATLRSNSPSVRVDFAWLLVTALLGILDVGLEYSLSVAGVSPGGLTAALGLCFLAAPVLWPLSIRRDNVSTPTPPGILFVN